MRADPDALAKTILGMPPVEKAGGTFEVVEDEAEGDFDSEEAALDSIATDAAASPTKENLLAAFRTILRLARES